MGKNSKAHAENHYKPDAPDFAYAEVDAPGGITLKDGRRINGKVLVPDGRFGYGDGESLAAMAGDTASRVSTDSQAGDRAYESAREQAAMNHHRRHIAMKTARARAEIPAAELRPRPDGKWELLYIRIDPDTGLMTRRSRVLTDAQVGHMRERYADQMQGGQQRLEDGTGWYIPEKAVR